MPEIGTLVQGQNPSITASNQTVIVNVDDTLTVISTRSGLSVNAQVVSTHQAANGVVYVIDTVVLSSMLLQVTSKPYSPPQKMAPPMSLTATASILGWNGFFKAVNGSGLYDVINNYPGNTL